MRAEKIESGVYSYFSAPIFLPAFLTNGHNSLTRELLRIHRTMMPQIERIDADLF
jgi:hypothetical protein